MSDQKNLSFTEFRERIGDLRGKEFWRSLEDLSRRSPMRSRNSVKLRFF